LNHYGEKQFILYFAFRSKIVMICFLFSFFLSIASATCSSCKVQQSTAINDFTAYVFCFSIVCTLGGFCPDLRTAKTIKQKYYFLLVLLSVVDVCLIHEKE